MITVKLHWALHSKLIIHRDLKLKNVFVDGPKKASSEISALPLSCRAVPSGYLPQPSPISILQPELRRKGRYMGRGHLSLSTFQLCHWRPTSLSFECNGAIKDKIRRKGGVNYKNYLSYTSKIKPFDESVPLDLAELISKMLQNKPENRIQWIDFYGCGVLIGTIRIEDCQVLFRSINKSLRQNKKLMSNTEDNSDSIWLSSPIPLIVRSINTDSSVTRFVYWCTLIIRLVLLTEIPFNSLNKRKMQIRNHKTPNANSKSISLVALFTEILSFMTAIEP